MWQYEQTGGQISGLGTTMRILVGVPKGDHSGFNYEPIDVRPTDSVDVLSEEFPSTNIGSCMLVQQIFLNAHALKFEDDEETFDHCNLIDGDTIYLLPTPRGIPVTVQHTSTGRNANVRVPALLPLSKLKSFLFTDSHKTIGACLLEYQQLTIEHNGQYLLDNTRTVVECNIQDNDTLHLVDILHTISVTIPTYEKMMERVVFPPNDTISTIKATVEAIQLSRGSAVVRLDIAPVALRGVLQNKKGTLVYLCLHLFQKGMSAHMDESTEESSQPAYRCVLKDEHTVEDIYKMIEKEDGYGLAFLNQKEAEVWRGHCIFDYTWTRTFAPKIDLDPVTRSGDRHLALYFFPCVTHVRSMHNISSVCSVRNFLESVCEKENMKGVKRDLCSLDDGMTLSRSSFISDSISPKIIPLFLRKRQMPIYQHHIKVHVTWPGRLTNAAEVLVEPNDTVSCLKDEIENVLKLPISLQVLVFSGEILEDNSALIATFGIIRDSVVELIPNLLDESTVASKDGTKKEFTLGTFVRYKRKVIRYGPHERNRPT